MSEDPLDGHDHRTICIVYSCLPDQPECVGTNGWGGEYPLQQSDHNEVNSNLYCSTSLEPGSGQVKAGGTGDCKYVCVGCRRNTSAQATLDEFE